MRTEIGAFDAKAKLSELLRLVEQGRHFIITVRGHPVAELVPYGHGKKKAADAAIESMRRMPKVRGVTPAQVAEWIAEGRK